MRKVTNPNYRMLSYHFDNEITIYPLSDLHIGAKGCMLKEIKDIIKKIKESPNTYFTLGGDLIDNAVLVGKGLGMYEVEKTPIEQIKIVVDLFKDIADKCLCIIPGNHEDRSEKAVGVNPAYLIATELGIKDRYKSALGLIKITVGRKENRTGQGRNQCYCIALHHGKGSADTSIKKDTDFSCYIEGLDVITTGHTHALRTGRIPKMALNKHSDVATPRDLVIIVSNSFLCDAEYGLKSMLIGSSITPVHYTLRLGEEKKVDVYS